MIDLSTPSSSRVVVPVPALARRISASPSVEVFPYEVRTPTTKIGGRLADFYEAWRSITANQTVLSYIRGAKTLFIATPTSAQSSYAQPWFSPKESLAVDEYVQSMLLAQIVVAVPKNTTQVVSPVFLTTNHDGSSRLIYNMKKINEDCIKTTHFKLETLAQILPLVPRNAWFTSWDLVQGFYNVLVHCSQQNLFCFDWGGQRYQFRALPMGCAESPRIFSKVVRAVIYAARARGINAFSYLDDTLTFDLDYDTTKARSYEFADLFTFVGFLLHRTKSVREPTQRIVFLGFIIDSTTMMLEVPEAKFTAVQALILHALSVVDSQTPTTIRLLARITGKLLSWLPATKYGKAHYRSLEYARNDALRAKRGDYDAMMTWPQTCRTDLEWWALLSHPVAASFETPRFSIHMTTDASLEGWGAVIGDSHASGTWDVADCDEIAYLELKAVLLGLQAFFHVPAPITIHLSTDNTVAKAYVNHMGGRVPQYDALARRIWFFLEDRNMFMVAFYVPSAANRADALTRKGNSRTADRFLAYEFMLKPHWFAHACTQLHVFPDIDWFASDDTAQLPRFCAWESSAQASCFDAFAHSWGSEVGYFFPPFALIPRVLSKIRDDQAHGLLVLPRWPGSAWWHLAMALAKDVMDITEVDPYTYPRRTKMRQKKPLFLSLMTF